MDNKKSFRSYFFITFLFTYLIIFSNTILFAQSLFEGAQESVEEANLGIDFNGYVRGLLYAGKVPDETAFDLKTGYGEAGLKIKVKKEDFGDAFAEFRVKSGSEFGEYISPEFELREAYASFYLDKIDFRLGYQIIAWGRADGFNPTDNITPKNMLSFSPDIDDLRTGNFLLRSNLNLFPVRLEGIWIPFYKSSEFSNNAFSFPETVSFASSDFPDNGLENSAFALRLNLEFPAFDGSISYFNGFNPQAGINISSISPPNLNIQLKAYRTHIFGADFSTQIGSLFILRGETAFRLPFESYENEISIPNPDFQWVLGMDKDFRGVFNIIFQYIGSYVVDYNELDETDPEYSIALFNRMIFNQLNQMSHAISCRLAWRLLQETFFVELFSYYSILTTEVLISPKISYDITDALTFTFGSNLYFGKDDTLFGTIDESLSSVYTQVKLSF